MADVRISLQATDNASAAIKSATSAVEQLRRGMVEAAATGRTLTTFNAGSLVSGISSATGAVNTLTGALREAVSVAANLAGGGGLSSIGSAITGRAAMAGAAAAGIVMLGAEVVKLTEHYGHLAEKMAAGAMVSGMNEETFSRLSGAMRIAGIEAGAADSSLRRLAVSLSEAQSNAGGRAADAMHRLGISQDEIVKHGNDVEYMFRRIIDAYQRYEHTATSAEAISHIFGRGVETLGPIFTKTSDEITELEKLAAKLGITLDHEAAAALRKSAEEARTLGLAIEGKLMQAFIAVAPYITSSIEKLREWASAAADAVAAVGKAMSASSAWSVYMAKDLTTALGRAGLTSQEGVNIPLPLALDLVIGAQRPGTKPGLPSVAPPTHAGGGRADHGPARAAMAEYRSELADLQGQLQNLTRTRQLDAQMADEQFAASKAVDYGGGATGHFARAQAEYAAYRAAQQEKIAALRDFQSQSDAIYRQIQAAALKEFAAGGEKYKAASAAEQSAAIWGENSAAYKKATADMTAASQEFSIQHLRMSNEIKSHMQSVIDAHTTAVEQMVRPWAETFDKIGTTIEDTIGTAIKSAFVPMKAEYWYSASMGPHGIPLTTAHRISPTSQLLSQAGYGILGDLGKQLQSSLMSSLAKSIFGSGTESFGSGIAKAIGIGGPGGLFGTGLGAVSQASGTAAFATSVGIFSTAVATFAAASGTSAVGSAVGAAGDVAGAAGGAASGLGAVGGILKMLPIVGSVFSLFARGGGIVPSAAGGWRVPSYAGGGIPGILHQNEMVLPSHLSQGIQNMINQGGGSGDIQLHFHGLNDLHSIERWFKQNLQSHVGSAVNRAFRSGGLTPRALF